MILYDSRYGEVYHGKWQGTDVAVKKFHAWDDKSWQREYEVSCYAKESGPNWTLHQNVDGLDSKIRDSRARLTLSLSQSGRSKNTYINFKSLSRPYFTETWTNFTSTFSH